LSQIFVESCVHFEVAHLAIRTHGLEIANLPYPEIPTLRDGTRLVPCDSHLWALQHMWSTATIEIYPYNGPCHCKNWLVTL